MTVTVRASDLLRALGPRVRQGLRWEFCISSEVLAEWTSDLSRCEPIVREILGKRTEVVAGAPGGKVCLRLRTSTCLALKNAAAEEVERHRGNYHRENFRDWVRENAESYFAYLEGRL